MSADPQGAAASAVVQHRHLMAAGGRLHVAEAGAGPPVLLLHGFPDHWRLWAPLMAKLSAGYRVMAPDLRGINLSDKPPSVTDYQVDALVDDVRTLIDALGGRCAVVGHDWGGMLAWTVAARHPAWVSRLVILNAPHPCRFARQLRSDPAQRAASDYIRRLCAPGAEAVLAENHFERLWSVRAASAPDAHDDAERAAFVQAWSHPGALTSALNWYRALDFDAALAPAGVPSVPDLAGAAGLIEAPTLVIWGERDGSFPPACLDGLDQWVPHLTLRRVPDGGHWLLCEQAERVAAWISDFLAAEA